MFSGCRLVSSIRFFESVIAVPPAVRLRGCWPLEHALALHIDRPLRRCGNTSVAHEVFAAGVLDEAGVVTAHALRRRRRLGVGRAPMKCRVDTRQDEAALLAELGHASLSTLVRAAHPATPRRRPIQLGGVAAARSTPII